MCIQSVLLGMLGSQEIILVGIIVLLLFGGKKIPELMRGLGKGVSEFKKAKEAAENEINDVKLNTPPKQDSNPITPPPSDPTSSPKQ
ncbi:MAG: twin-arginine translocase TatA/TatE family subunit [Bacteroidota bacterium]